MPAPSPIWPVLTVDSDEGRVWLQWLVRLRWVAITAQFVTLSFVARILWSPLLLVPLGIVVVLLILGNLRAIATLSSDTQPVGQDVLLSQLVLDVVALTAFFVLAGGRDNPFTPLYLVHVAMAAIMLRPALSATLTAAVLVCYGLLHITHVPLLLDNHYLKRETLIPMGQIVSFAITSVSVAAFVMGMANTLRARKRQLLEARDRSARTDRLRSVGTLAAGAAHEINTPLSTIDLRIRRIRRRHSDMETAKDLGVIASQLDRCKAVVDQLLIGAGDPSASEMARQPLSALVEEAVHLWSFGSGLEVDYQDRSRGLSVEVPRIAFTQGLINLLENAKEAQMAVRQTEPLVVRVIREGEKGVVLLRDRGCGLPQNEERVGEPFFTTKETGTGLGVFVARAVADGAGGGLRYVGGDGTFTTEARWSFPETTSRRTAL